LFADLSLQLPLPHLFTTMAVN